MAVDIIVQMDLLFVGFAYKTGRQVLTLRKELEICIKF
jgi:hypothetical protein